MGTWYQFRQDVKALLTDVTANDDLFAAACAAYVKSTIAREVDHDILMRKSYWDSYLELKRRLVGFQTTLVVGSTLDTAVRKLLPVDDQREGIQTFLTQQIKNAYQELSSVETFLVKLIREAVIDLQSYIPCYRVSTETVYTSTDVVVTANMSRGPMPPQAELTEGFYLLEIQPLAINTAYQPGDYVASNGRTYMVLSSGQITTLGSGLTTTDGSVETLDGMTFTFFYGESCLRSELNVRPWKDRFRMGYLHDGCRGDKNLPAFIFIDREAFSFYIWPKLDSTHKASLFWTGLKFSFADGDTVPFDETAAQAVREFVLSKYYDQVEQDVRQAQIHAAAYTGIRARAFVDCKNRQFLEYQ